MKTHHKFHLLSFKIAIFLIFLLSITHLYAENKSVTLKWNGKLPELPAGISWGVPFEKGIVKRTQQFVLYADDKRIPLQQWNLAYWPDGSLKWVGFATVTNHETHFRLEPISSPNSPEGITVQNNPTSIFVDNGALQCVFNKKGNHFIKSITRNKKLIATNGMVVCTLEDKSEINQNILKFNDFESNIDSVQIEQQGSVRVVIKINGQFKSLNSDRKIFPFTVRFYFYNKLNTIKMIHTFIYNGDQNRDFVKGLGIRFEVPFREKIQNRQVKFSGENDGIWSEPVKPLIGRSPFNYRGDYSIPKKQVEGQRIPDILPDDSVAFTYFNHFAAWNDFKLLQLNPDGFTIQKRTNPESSWLFSNAGKRASGFVMVGDVSGGLGVSLHDFWQSYPTALEVNNARTNTAKLTVWLWAKEAEAMDLRHYDTIAHDLDATYEDVQPGLSTPYGVARTHELSLFILDSLPSNKQAAQMADFGTDNHLLTCTPEYFHQVKAFGIWSLPTTSTPTRQWIENQLDSLIIYYQQAINERYWYGFWNFGDIMHTYDPVRHVWRYDIGGFAWDNTELAPNDWLWYSFLRTGRFDIFKMAEAMTRHTGEVDAYHLGDLKGLGSRHNVSHWGCGSKEARIGQAAWKRFYYYLTTDERCGDLMHESLDAEKAIVKFDPLRIAQPRSKFPFDAPARLRWGPDWLALAGNWMTEWERTGNTVYRDKILSGLKSLTKLPDNLFTGPNGLCYDPASGKIWYDGKSNIVNKNHLATIMGGYEILSELFNIIDYKPFIKTFTEYCRFYSMPANDPHRNDKTRNWGDINFLNPRLTAFAAHELNDTALARRAWNEFFAPHRRFNSSIGFRNIGGSKQIKAPEVLNPVHENPMISTNSTAQWSLNAIILPELIGNLIDELHPTNDAFLFQSIENQHWKILMHDSFKDLNKYWFLDGQKASLSTSNDKLLFKAGSEPASDADHSVLWTKSIFKGSLKIEFDFTRKDSATKYVNIIYLMANGSNINGYDKDIYNWNEKRKIPAMRIYFEHMDAYHISFAAFENDNSNPLADYVKARRYLPERSAGLEGTNLKPDYYQTGLFIPNQKYHITIIKSDNQLFMQAKNKSIKQLFHWDTSNFPSLNAGRIGLRLMGSRASEFDNFKVYSLN